MYPNVIRANNNSNLSSWTDPLKNLRRQRSSGDKLRMIYSSLSVNGHSYAKFHYSLAIPYWYLHSSRTRIFRPQSQIGLSSDPPLVMQVFTRGDEPDCPETHFLLWFFFLSLAIGLCHLFHFFVSTKIDRVSGSGKMEKIYSSYS